MQLISEELNKFFKSLSMRVKYFAKYIFKQNNSADLKLLFINTYYTNSFASSQA
jgi:hypothetical protein